MKKMGATLIFLSLILFIWGVFSYKTDLSNEKKDLYNAVTKDDGFYPDQVKSMYHNKFTLDIVIVGFGVVSLVVGGFLLSRKEE